MFSFFRHQQSHDSRDLEQVIFDVAEHQKDKDFHALYELMARRHVFVPVDTNTLPQSARAGERYVVGSSDRLCMRYVTGPNNKLLAPAATREDSPLLKGGYVGMEWGDFLGMVTKLNSSFYGALLQGKTSWVAFDRERIKYILALSSANPALDTDAAR